MLGNTCGLKYRLILTISCVKPSGPARNQGHDKRGEIAFGSIHQGLERPYMMTLEKDKKCLCVWLLYILCGQFSLIREWRCQDIDQVLLHGDHLVFSVHSVAVKC